jgi:transcriptional regulator with XRE-family HTH domain
MDTCSKLELYGGAYSSKSASVLYPIPPIGVGEGHVESLTSYIIRLAEAHCVRTGDLFSNILFPYLNKSYMLKGGYRFYTSAHLINGVTGIAYEFIEMLTNFTGIKFIDELTLIRFKNVLPTRGLLRSNKAWCPYCIDEMGNESSVVFEPLAWSLQAITVCLKHLVPIEDNCPSCGNKFLSLDGRSISGHCPKCNGWLGKPSTSCGARSVEDWEIYKAKLIHELFASGMEFNNKKNVAWTLSRLVATYTDGNVSEFAKLLGVPKTTLWGWYGGKNLPTLEDVLRICNKCDVNLISFYSGNRGLNNHGFVLAAKRINKQDVCLTSKPIQKIGKSLKRLLMNRESMCMNVTHIARKLRCNKKTLYKYYKTLCKYQTRMNRYYQTASKGIRLTKLNAEICRAFTDLVGQGQTPTVSMIEKQLNRPNALREEPIKDFYERLRMNA